MKKIINNSLNINTEILFFSVLLSFVRILFGGYSFGRSDLTAHLVPIFRRIDSSFLVNDFFTNNSLEFGPTYYFSILMSILGKYIPLDYLFLFSTFISNFIICLISIITFKYLFDSSNKLACLSALFIMTIDPFNSGGGGWLIDSYFKPASFVRVFSYLSLFYALKRNIIVSTILICLGSLIHPTIALESGLICYLLIFVYIIYDLKFENNFSILNLIKDSYSLILSGVFLIIFVSIFWLIPYGDSKMLSNTDFLEIFLFRTYNDVVPSSFYFKGYIYAFVYSLLLLISLTWYQLNHSKSLLPLTIKVVSIFVFLFCLGGYVFVEIFPSRLWASAMTFRMLYVYKWIGMMLVVYSMSKIIKNPINFSLIIRFWSRLIFYLKESFPSILPLWCLVPILLVSILFLSMPSLLAFTAHPGLALFFSLICLVWILFFKNIYLKYLLPIFLMTIVAVDILNPFLPLPNKIRKFYPKVKISYDIYDDGAQGVSDFARTSIDEDAVFIVPPNFGGFRHSANRAIIIDRKCILFDDKGLYAWWERINDSYGKIPANSSNLEMNQSMYINYRSINRERILKLYEKYNATHAVLFSDTITDFKILYRDENYKLISIN